MRIDVVTIFPELFEGPLSQGLLGKSIAAGNATVALIDPRAFTTDKHRSVDDTPYGGGAGMVMRPGPLVAAIEAARTAGGPGPVVLLTPQGTPLSQRHLARWAAAEHLVLVAGRYEGFDERIRAFADEEISLGDFVLTGGEYAALVVIDGVVRLLPGTVGNEQSILTDSFSHGLLEHPHYTRPVDFRGRTVPEVLLSGDHAAIDAWRRRESLLRTRARRPDLLAKRRFSAEELEILGSASRAWTIELAITAPDEPLEPWLFALARLAAAYGLSRAVVLTARHEELEAFRAKAAAIDPAPTARPRGRKARAAADRAEQARRTHWHKTLSSIELSAEPVHQVIAGAKDRGLRVVAGVPGGGLAGAPAATVGDDPGRSDRGLLLLIGLDLGAAATPGEAGVDAVLPAIRAHSPSHRVPALVAAAILLDRLLGEA